MTFAICRAAGSVPGSNGRLLFYAAQRHAGLIASPPPVRNGKFEHLVDLFGWSGAGQRNVRHGFGGRRQGHGGFGGCPLNQLRLGTVRLGRQVNKLALMLLALEAGILMKLPEEGPKIEPQELVQFGRNVLLARSLIFWPPGDVAGQQSAPDPVFLLLYPQVGKDSRPPNADSQRA